MLRRLLLSVRAGSSNLAKSVYAVEMYQHENLHLPGLFFGGKPDETCCHSVVASKWLETRVSHFALQDENTTT